MISERPEGLARRLAASAPIADPELLVLLVRYEALGLRELTRAMDAAEERFRRWVEAPVNAGRPIRQASGYRDRIALGLLLEKRTFGG